ncbi:unnamed protein product [Rotaria sp. Silwood2]|nr:unnamed protein product [Rotaria sp. Silwood2]CAF4067661.1 unnamed protein product [Rotaria sp. Silwood2]
MPTVGPLIICGLPRTGSTLLYNLLACDPNSRAPLFTEMCVESVPPISRSNSVEQERRTVAARLSAQMNEQLVGRTDMMAASHPRFAIEEDYHILRQAGVAVFYTMECSEHQSECESWLYDDTNKDYAYDYHETFLRMLNSADASPFHWLLKSPVHSLYLNTLLRHYPNAALIMTHRRLDDLLPSYCRLVWAFCSVNFSEADSTSQGTVTTLALKLIDKMIQRIVKFRTCEQHSEDQAVKAILDVAYDDLMNEPIGIVHRIYDHFALRWSDAFEAAMRAWLRDNPQGKQGRHTYSLTEIGLTREDIETRYADYINLFFRSSPSNTVSSN